MKLQSHLSQQLSNPGSLRVFGLVLFTREHACLSRVLSDTFNWRAFDEMTGEHFAVFSARAASPLGGRTAFVALSDEPAANRELCETFHLESTKGLPRFVVFAHTGGDEFLQCSIPLSNKTDQEAHDQLKAVVEFVVQIAKGIAPENRSATNDVFAAFEMQLREFHERETIKNVLGWAPLLGKLWKLLY